MDDPRESCWVAPAGRLEQRVRRANSQHAKTLEDLNHHYERDVPKRPESRRRRQHAERTHLSRWTGGRGYLIADAVRFCPR